MSRAIPAMMGIMAALVVAVGVTIVVLVLKGGGGAGGGSGCGHAAAAANATEQAAGGPTGELCLAGGEPITLDPALAQDEVSTGYIVEIFGGLLTLSPQLQLQPDIAQDIPTAQNGGKVVNADGTVTYTFHIRDGVLFHDRKPVSADTVKCSLERAADPSIQSLVSEYFLGDIVGVKDKLAGKASEISGVKVIDPATLSITIPSDLSSFLYKLSYPTAFVIDPTQVGGKCGTEDFGKGDSNWSRHPNGTGAYELKAWTNGERIVLQANDHYHLGSAQVKKVTFLLAGAGLTAYQAGDIDATGVSLDDLTRVQDPSDPLNRDYKTSDRLALDYIGFDTTKPPFDDAKVRQAFAMAIDKSQIASAVFKDALPVANSIDMPGMPAYNQNAHAPAFDPAQAQQLLKDSTYGGPGGLPSITFAESGTGATAGDATSAILDMWRTNLGVNVQIQQAEPATFFRDIANGRYQMFHLGWIMDYPDEEDLFNIHFDSKSPNNDTGYNSPQVDALLHSALTETDPQKRNQDYQQAEQQVLTDVPWIPLFFDRVHVLIKPYVQGLPLPAAVVPRLRYVSVTTP
jgi:oligopeptide transport system substrate-binding protein